MDQQIDLWALAAFFFAAPGAVVFAPSVIDLARTKRSFKTTGDLLSKKTSSKRTYLCRTPPKNKKKIRKFAPWTTLTNKQTNITLPTKKCCTTLQGLPNNFSTASCNFTMESMVWAWNICLWEQPSGGTGPRKPERWFFWVFGGVWGFMGFVDSFFGSRVFSTGRVPGIFCWYINDLMMSTVNLSRSIW